MPAYRGGGCFMQLDGVSFECSLFSLSCQQSCWVLVGNLRLGCLLKRVEVGSSEGQVHSDGTHLISKGTIV